MEKTINIQFTHLLSGQKMLLKRDYGGVCSFYLLDDSGKKIREAGCLNKDGSPSFEKRICNKKNLK